MTGILTDSVNNGRYTAHLHFLVNGTIIFGWFFFSIFIRTHESNEFSSLFSVLYTRRTRLWPTSWSRRLTNFLAVLGGHRRVLNTYIHTRARTNTREKIKSSLFRPKRGLLIREGLGGAAAVAAVAAAAAARVVRVSELVAVETRENEWKGQTR